MRAVRRLSRLLVGVLLTVLQLPMLFAGGLVLRRLRRLMEKTDISALAPCAYYIGAALLFAGAFYSVSRANYLDGLADRILVAAGLSVDNIEIKGHSETSKLAVLERLEIDNRSSLVTYDVSEARNRIIGLPWVGSASVRKMYPSSLIVSLEERVPYALWQRGNVIIVIDRSGTPIIEYADSRFASLPLVVGYGAEAVAEEFITLINSFPSLAPRVRASVFVSERRWNLILENGITIKLPEQDMDTALDVLARYDREEGLLARNVSEVDLRMPDRIIVRVAEGDSETAATDDRDKKRIAHSGRPI